MIAPMKRDRFHTRNIVAAIMRSLLLFLTAAMPMLWSFAAAGSRVVAQMTVPLTAPSAASIPAAPQPPAPVAEQAIPLPQIADQAEALDDRLEEIARSLTANPNEALPGSGDPEQAKEIAERSRQVDSFLQSEPDVLQLRDEIVYWHALSRSSGDQRRLLTDRADQLQSQLAFLAREQVRWQATRDQIHDDAGIEVVSARVQQELDSLGALRLQVQARLNQVLTLQNQLSETGRRVSDSLAKLNDIEARLRVSLFQQDGYPLWSGHAFRETEQPIGLVIRRSTGHELVTAKEFLRLRAPTMLALMAVFVLCFFGAFRLRRYLATLTQPDTSVLAHEVFAHPLAIALLAVLFVSIPFTSSAPLSITTVSYLLWIGLVFRLTPILIQPGMRPLVYLVLALNLLEIVRAATPLPAGAHRLLAPMVIVAVMVAFGVLGRPSRLRHLPLSQSSVLMLQVGIWTGLLLLGLALVANIFGFISLSRVLGAGTLLSAFLAAALYCLSSILFLVLCILLEGPWAASFSADHRRDIKLWGRRIIVLFAALLWWTRSDLYLFIFQESMKDSIARVLGYSIGPGKMQFTVGTVLTVGLILGIGYGLAKGSSTLLRSILQSRFPLQRGLPYAISKVTYYCLMLLVMATAVTSAGVELNKFTVITGALGVGIGFGLQNIVSNFASGLILLFERPIRVDDTIEVNNLIGNVKRIGARSSTLTTGQGAEVIVPNSTLLSNQVVNWTLSSPWRRVEILVGVTYGSDPQEVIKLLVGVAAGCPDVLQAPPPEAFFLGFGDSALNFELRFWSARQETWFQLKSDVSIGVAVALRDAGIEIPFPQRDLHLRSVDASIASQASLLPQIPDGPGAPGGEGSGPSTIAKDLSRAVGQKSDDSTAGSL